MSYRGSEWVLEQSRHTCCLRFFVVICRMKNDKAANRHVKILLMNVGREGTGVLTRMHKTQ